MAKNEKTSPRLARIASKGLRAPSTLKAAEVKALAGSVLTQAPDRPKPKRKAKR